MDVSITGLAESMRISPTVAFIFSSSLRDTAGSRARWNRPSLTDRAAHRVLHGRIRSSYNALDAAIEGPEPSRFLDTYGEIISEKNGKFTSVLRNMLKFYKVDEINGQLDRTKKALGNDLRAEQSSGDKAHLSEILDSLSSTCIFHLFPDAGR